MSKSTIITERLVLRPPMQEDAERVFACWAGDPEVTRYLTFRPHETAAESRKWIEETADAWADGSRSSWVILRAADRELIGGIALSPEGLMAHVGYVLGRSEWGRGYATEALAALVEVAFADPGLYRFYAYCHVDNLASARVLEKAGLEREGRLRRFLIFPNLSAEPLDVFVYARCR